MPTIQCTERVHCRRGLGACEASGTNARCTGAPRRSSSTLPQVSGNTKEKSLRVRLFPGGESKQPAGKAKEKVEAFGAEGDEVRRRPKERVRRDRHGVTCAELEQKNAEVCDRPTQQSTFSVGKRNA